MSSDHRRHYEDDERVSLPGAGGYSSGNSYVGTAFETSVSPDKSRPEFTLLVAGCRGGKTSFLRLLLDTCNISSKSSKEQLNSVAKFVQGSSGHTSHIRAASIDVDVDLDGSGSHRPLGLTLIDTPSLDLNDENVTDHVVQDILRHIDSRFSEGLEDEWKAQHGDRFIHLCVYFLDPDKIVPPPVPAPPAPYLPRTRTNSFSQTEEPVILEPPVTTNPLLCRPTLPTADINTIRKLSSRVNVLPVIARADVLSNERLSAIKLAVRRDLAEAGIGFGIFDMDSTYVGEELPPARNGESSNGYAGHSNGSSKSPPASPASPSLMRLPYALISPDMYSHSDGVLRPSLSRHELVLQYSPSYQQPPPSKIVRGRFTRKYRWCSLDVLDSTHSDFLPFRNAIFHHMETLQKYTREYLFDKFKEMYLPQRPTSRHSLQQHHHAQSLQHLGHGSRPILAIDTAASPVARHPSSLQISREIGPQGDFRSPNTSSRHIPESHLSMKTSASSRLRTKKITVACNFCRSRKLKCDGGRPACSQCVKRSNPCDYQVQNKRRGTIRSKHESDSDSEERSLEHEPSYSPDIPSSHKPSLDSWTPSLISGEEPSSSRKISLGERGSYFMDNELPHIATLSLPDRSPSTPVPMSAPSLPPIRPASEQQAAQRKRASTVPGKSTRQLSTSGPKVVACNFCRARKTKCDGAQPACSSCTRRSLSCNYVHDASTNGSSARKLSRRSSTSKPPPDSPPSSRMIPTPVSATGGYDPRDDNIKIETEQDLKRPLGYSDMRPIKKMRMETPQIVSGLIP
ncbi:GTP binding protein [Mycena floridula]|nr:GTP binding protein [Mycena floridula]